ncbi:uncharacterized protein [Rutidosis leptorrhynchoides]|uniref:uncharacterized protein n=1 Tax=Rutidosis leptorrhynchoides TaxID=125765 RepID=UPI003A99AAB2
MTESSTTVRLVRCPKCENLLQELPDYSVYQCGACATVLRAKNKQQEEGDALLEMTDGERPAIIPAKSQSSSEKEKVILSDASDTDNKLNPPSSSGCYESSPEKKDEELAESCGPNGKADKLPVDPDLNANIDKSENHISREQEGLDSNIGGSHGSGRMSDWRARERVPRREEVEGVRFSTSNYLDKSTHQHPVSSFYGYGGPLRSRMDPDGRQRVQYLEHDRVELLKKLDELREQLSRSCDVADKTKEKFFPAQGRVPVQDPYGRLSNAWIPNAPPISNKGSPFLNNSPDLFPMHGAYPSHSIINSKGQIPGYRDTFGSQMIRRAPDKLSGQYPYYSDQFIDPFRQNTSLHQPHCSCFHCYQQVSAFGNNRLSDVPSNPMMYLPENPSVFGSRAQNVRNSAPPPRMNDVHGPPQRWPSDLNPEISGRPRRSSGIHRRPVAGGAPFLTCHNCFELLRLPKKVMHMGKNEQRMRCGACSTVISFTVNDKKLIISDDAGVAKESSSFSHGRVNRFSSDDYDSYGYDFQTLDKESLPILPSLNSVKPQEMQTFLSTSPSTSEDENSPNILVDTREDLANAAFKTTKSPPLPVSPLQENFDYSASCNNNNEVNRFGKGNRSSRSEQEKVMPNKVTTRQNSLKEATEMDVSFNELSNSDSGDANRKEEVQPRTNKGGESFFASIIKKSFKDFTKTNNNNQSEHPIKGSVSINGHPIPDRLVKKAEKQAGQVHPGQYWYDFRAGFWGIMGGPCLGIIPPFIEEFNYPMPQKCAGGNTLVFVNGRELHQKDMELLAARGLPVEGNRRYIIEINGRVLDEDTGEELDSLGKLAPTVERLKHGFGMKAPKTMAA